MRFGNVDIYADGATPEFISEASSMGRYAGYTSNPTLAKKIGVVDYATFCRDSATAAAGLPMSLEVLGESEADVLAQARWLRDLGTNVVVKVPVVTSSGESQEALIKYLYVEGVPLNITAVTHQRQVQWLLDVVTEDQPAIVSVFCGRIADAGRDAAEAMAAFRSVFPRGQGVRLLWASPRQVYNVVEADRVNADIITVPTDMASKLDGLNTDLDEVSRRTVQMFTEDARASGFSLPC